MRNRVPLTQRFEQTAFVSDPFACDVEGRSVIDRASDHIETDGHVDARLEIEHLYRTVALVVVEAGWRASRGVAEALMAPIVLS